MDNENREEQLRAYPQKGTNQVAVRSYNERLVLQLVREHGSLTKADATRATGLSPNAASVIFRSLEEEGLLLRGERIRGRIGQPSTPMRLNPDAHHYVVLKIGRRSLELAVVNFIGEIEAIKRIQQPYPTPNSVLEFLRSNLTGVLRSAKQSRKSISGMAVAMPFELWSWTEEFDAPETEMEAWRQFDPIAEFEKLVPWKVVVENDATAACRAEQVFGARGEMQDWIYFFVGTFIGGGIVLNGSVFPGRRGNAGGFGPMRVPEREGGDRLVDHASLVVLEHSIAAAGGQPFEIYNEETDWGKFEPFVSDWILRAARSLAHATVSSLSVLDFEAVVIDGALPDDVKTRLVDEVRHQMEITDLQGVFMPKIEAGKTGRRARTIGAAASLISRNYLIDQNTLMRT
ncbi:MAG: ROK family transcriptional regulator [Roseibium sp.]|uniref:ROK family transcriptional regulator n=1 Tax=Roseibium sp. TaxID=1936156 RepID=UPI00262AFBEF|nr:ROK family transcriptional regulator [Roseibium sp.]MCV0425063.1 ROK family transcriptional regulator [Roseibium sp.]